VCDQARAREGTGRRGGGGGRGERVIKRERAREREREEERDRESEREKEREREREREGTERLARRTACGRARHGPPLEHTTGSARLGLGANLRHNSFLAWITVRF